MAQFDGTVYSASLGMMTAIAVSLPAEGREQPGGLPGAVSAARPER